MGLLSIFKRQDDSSSNAGAAANGPEDAVQKARTRARQRLIGAAVLLAIGIIGFPLLFETQPRPIPVDVVIEVPRKENAPALVMPSDRSPGAPLAAASAVSRPPDTPVEPRAPTPAEVITESRAEAGRNVIVSPPALVTASAPSTRPVPRAASAPAVAAAPEAAAAKPAAQPKPAAASTDGARAKALLEDKPAAAAESVRFVVQVGAFAEAGAARETRQRVEKLGLKTYTQVTRTGAGERIRVRVGPFSTRIEADQALGKARSAGLDAVVLTL